ncbi:MAG: hypothetical protein E7774_05370 [Bradyrhizobium sp.]|nr:MAG: hypothetical protein E7774_05370 [Bradyrhizobium sp.]
MSGPPAAGDRRITAIMGAGAKSGRDIVAYFAGHLANLANGNDALADDEEFVLVKPFHLFERVRRLLTGNRRYSDGLLGVWAYPPPDGAEEAAEFYFDRVLDRPIAARRGEPTSADNLAALVATRAVGPLGAVATGESLSTWKALAGGPAKRRRFRETSELFEFSNRILKCLDAANRPYAETLRLGLCPKEWLVGDDAAGVNTLKSANGFLKALKAEMGDVLGRRPSDKEIAAAFAAAPVPGCKSGAEFAATPLGGAIITRVAGQDQTFIVSFESVEATQAAEIADEAEGPLMTQQEAAPFLEAAVAAGAIAPPERDLLAAIMAGRTLAEALGDNLFLRRRVKADFDGEIAAYVEDLSARTARFVVGATTRP